MTASDRFMEFCVELNALLKEYNASLDVELTGDTHCLDTKFVIEIKDENYRSESHVIHNYASYLDSSDLSSYIKDRGG